MPLDTSPYPSYPSDAFSNPSTPDPYNPSSSTHADNLPPHIHLSALPRPLPLLGPLTGFTSSKLNKTISNRFIHLSRTINRPLTPDEQSAVAYHSAKGIAIASWGPSLGLAAGVYRTWRTREVYRWPFYGELRLSDSAAEGKTGQKGFWDGERLKVGGKEVLKNVSKEAKSAGLHFARGAAYVGLAMFVVPMFVSAYAASVVTVGEMRDQRMGNVMRTLRLVANKERRGKARAAGEVVGMEPRNGERGQDKERRRRDPLGQGERDSGELWRGHRESIEMRGSGGGMEVEVDGDGNDEASPTGGMGLFDFTEEEAKEKRALGGSDTGLMGDREMRDRETRMQSRSEEDRGGSSGGGDGGRRPNTFEIEKAQRQPQGFGDTGYDDASPTGGTGAMDPGDEGASAWDRIRQGAASGGPDPRPRRRGRVEQQQQQQQEGESFSFSGSDEERGYAQSEAQKEFDERVERERRGGDFGDEGKRW